MSRIASLQQLLFELKVGSCVIDQSINNLGGRWFVFPSKRYLKKSIDQFKENLMLAVDLTDANTVFIAPSAVSCGCRQSCLNCCICDNIFSGDRWAINQTSIQSRQR